MKRSKSKTKLHEDVAAPAKTRLEELLAPQAITSQVIDEGETWLVPNVVLLGEFSQNKGPSGKVRRYPQKTMEAALPKFANLRINTDHPDPAASGRRPVLTRIGMAVNPKLVQEGSQWNVKGDLRLVKVPAADHIVKLIKLDPKIAGMSITGDGSFREGADEKYGYDDVEGLEPCSVDVVDRSATTKGFFEDKVQEADLPALHTAAEAASAAAKDNETHIAAHAAWDTLYHNAQLAKDDKLAEEAKAKAEEHMKAAGVKEGAVLEPGWTEEMEKKFQESVKPLLEAKDDDDDDDEEAPEHEAGETPEEEEDEGAPHTDDDSEDNGEDDEGDDEKVDEEGDPDEGTEYANQLTNRAKLEKTSDSHLKAAFGHLYASGMHGHCGCEGRGMEHFEKAKEHFARVEQLREIEKQKQAPPAPGSPMQGSQVDQQGAEDAAVLGNIEEGGINTPSKSNKIVKYAIRNDSGRYHSSDSFDVTPEHSFFGPSPHKAYHFDTIGAAQKHAIKHKINTKNHHIEKLQYDNAEIHKVLTTEANTQDASLQEIGLPATTHLQESLTEEERTNLIKVALIESGKPKGGDRSGVLLFPEALGKLQESETIRLVSLFPAPLTKAKVS